MAAITAKKTILPFVAIWLAFAAEIGAGQGASETQAGNLGDLPKFEIASVRSSPN